MLIMFLIIFQISTTTAHVIHGKFTDNIHNYHLLVPHKVTPEGDFSTFELSHYYKYDASQFLKRRKREAHHPDSLHYGVMIDNDLHHLELWPNQDFLHPEAVIEWYDPTLKVKDREVRGIGGKKMCYYMGQVRGKEKSKVALSTCNGLAGFILIDGKMHFIEPVADHTPNSKGHHLHVAYHPSVVEKNENKKYFCGTEDSTEEWNNSIKKYLMKEYLKGNNIFKREIDIEIKPMYLEKIIVVDKDFIEIQKGKRDLEEVVLFFLSLSRTIYADASLEEILDIVILRIIYLEKDNRDLQIIPESKMTTLSNFCTWANKLQPENVDHPQHFDVATLYTGLDICSEGRCDVTGAAYMNEACGEKINRNCGFIEFLGLKTFVTEAHESGHLFGMQHDKEDTPCPQFASDGSYYMMNPYCHLFMHQWSQCSVASLRTVANIGLLDCLKDTPVSNGYVLHDRLPGLVYSRLDQCKMELNYRNVTGLCVPDYEDEEEEGDLDDIDCSHLGCEVDGNCTGIAEMLADGTKCNKDKWCIHGKCVTKGTRPQAVDGGWGEWGPWSACTRSCGRGTQHQERLCDNPQPSNTGKICVGSRVKIRICNPQECPMDAVPFREQACIEHLKTLNRTDEKVIGAQYKRDSPCTMYCFLKKEGEKDIQLTSFYNTPLPDGAKCEIGNPLKMCVMSKCMEVACDNQIEKSTAVLDRCGICNGPGTQCNVIDESRTIPKANKKNVNAKVLVTVVPAGSKKVKITKEPSMSKLMLGLPDNRTFYFNEKTFMWVGVHNLGYNHKEFFLYTHTELPDKTISEEVLWDMTPEDVGVYVEISFTDTKVKWHWIELLNNPKIEPKYRWDIVEYKRCTAKCEGGIQEPMINCLEETAGKVADAYCEKLEKPEVPARKCNEKPCITEWRVGKWGRCRACKKKGGVRLRDVQCVKQNPNPIGDYIIVEDSECKEVKPGRVELCETKKKCRSHSRRSVFIPGKFQEGLWKQMNKLHIKKRGSESLAFRKGHFPTSSTMTSPLTWIPTLNHDKNDSKLVIDHGSTNPLIPMKSSHRSKCINLDQEKELELPVNPISSTPNTNRSTC